MSEVLQRFCIGGPVARSSFPALLDAFAQLEEEYGLLDDELPHSETDLTRPQFSGSEILITLLDASESELNWLERVCQRIGVGFDHFLDGDADEDPRVRRWRPGLDLQLIGAVTLGYGGPVGVDETYLFDILSELKARRYKAGTRMLEDLLGPRIPDLEPLSIKEDPDDGRGDGTRTEDTGGHPPGDAGGGQAARGADDPQSGTATG